jgi:hypothetical protein
MNEHTVPCKSNFNVREYPRGSGASRHELADQIRAMKAAKAMSGMLPKAKHCASLKRNDEPVHEAVPDYNQEELNCGDRYDPENPMKNKTFEQIHAMAVDYNHNNPNDMIPYIGEKNKIELCRDLMEKGIDVHTGKRVARPRSRKACANRSMKWVSKSKNHIGFCRVKNNAPAKKSKSRKSKKSRKSRKSRKSKSRKAAKAPASPKVYLW